MKTKIIWVIFTCISMFANAQTSAKGEYVISLDIKYPYISASSNTITSEVTFKDNKNETYGIRCDYQNGKTYANVDNNIKTLKIKENRTHGDINDKPINSRTINL